MAKTTTFRTTDLPIAQTTAEFFADKRFRILSRSGLHPTETLLIAQICARLPDAPAPAHILITGNRTGAAVMVATALFPDSHITCHTLDLYYARTILRNLQANKVASAFIHDPNVHCPIKDTAPGKARVLVSCTLDMPDAPYDLALFAGASTSGITGELYLDQLEEVHERLVMGGLCIVAYEGKKKGHLKPIKKIFHSFTVHMEQKRLFCASARKQRPLDWRRRNFCGHFKGSIALPNTSPIILTSLPGVFCHRRADKGGIALTEIAIQELLPNRRVLDLGCGCGLVGVLLAVHQVGTSVTFVDSYARAIASTSFNLSSLELDGHTLVLSDAGLQDTGVPTGEFDMVVANPPYFSDFRIAQLFVDTAYEALRPGGLAFFVTQSPEGIIGCLRNRFAITAISIVNRRGYYVIRAMR